MRVLEIGAGKGYNAALLATSSVRAGRRHGQFRRFLVEKVRRQLAAAGFGRVEVVQGDGALGYPPSAPFDRIVATVGLRRSAGVAGTARSRRQDRRATAPRRGAQDHVLVSLEVKDGYLEASLGGLANGPSPW
jgi:hypothetical protein